MTTATTETTATVTPKIAPPDAEKFAAFVSAFRKEEQENDTGRAEAYGEIVTNNPELTALASSFVGMGQLLGMNPTIPAATGLAYGITLGYEFAKSEQNVAGMDNRSNG